MLDCHSKSVMSFGFLVTRVSSRTSSLLCQCRALFLYFLSCSVERKKLDVCLHGGVGADINLVDKSELAVLLGVHGRSYLIP